MVKKIGLMYLGIPSLLVIILANGARAASTGKLLHSFTGTPDGGSPESSLILDGHGNLFGTTDSGGTGGGCFGGCGTVVELTPNGKGGFDEHVIYSFQGSPVDGQNPQAPLILDSAGNLYGTTVSGGAGLTGAGSVFELSPQQDGTWKETVLHSFTGGNDGGNLRGGLIFDAAGNLYGTASGGGTGIGCAGGIGCGVVFELTLSSSGWSETILHNFTNNHSDGWSPFAALIADANGNFYSTTFYGGSSPNGGGTVFKLTSTATGWKESVLYNFSCGSDGCSPYSSLLLDNNGNLYGTTVGGGTSQGFGVVFKLMPNGTGGYAQSVIHTFTSGKDGEYPYGNVIADESGNLYSTTLYGGGGDASQCSDGCGTIYELTPSTHGNYTETILGRAGNGTFGIGPLSGLLMDAKGALYGAISAGGPGEHGTLFKLVP